MGASESRDCKSEAGSSPYAPAITWPDEAAVCERCGLLPGMHVLDVDVDSIAYYACGTWALVERDVRVVLADDSAVAAVLAFLEGHELPQAFALRSELCNLKKAAFFLLQQMERLERQLAQLATFFHGDHEFDAVRGFWVHTERLTRLSDARSQAKGACAAQSDARALAKHCCALSRHPSKAAPPFLASLPSTLHAWRAAVEAASVVGVDIAETEAAAAAARAAAAAAGGAEAEAAAAADDGGASWHERVSSSLGMQVWPPHVRAFVAAVLLARGGDKALRIRDAAAASEAALQRTLALIEVVLRRLRSLESVDSVVARLRAGKATRGSDGTREPSAASASATAVTKEGLAASASTVTAATVAEGAAADAVVRAEGAAADAAVRAEGAAADAVVRASAVATGSGITEAGAADRVMQQAMRRHKHLNVLGGALPILRDTLRWLRAARAAAASGSTSFVVGDARGATARGQSRTLGYQPALCVPGLELESARLASGLRAAEEAYRPQMRAQIAEAGWPERLVSRRGGTSSEKPADNKQCRSCAQGFSALWVHRGTCCECEATLRAQGRCPYSERCSAAGFCPHARRCFVCDAHSCAECRLERGSAEAVADVAARVRPVRIALDFDRTLCNTKSGALPIFGKHQVDDGAALDCE